LIWLVGRVVPLPQPPVGGSKKNCSQNARHGTIGTFGNWPPKPAAPKPATDRGVAVGEIGIEIEKVRQSTSAIG